MLRMLLFWLTHIGGATVTGCEMRRCPYLKEGVCTDPEPIYEKICRFNDYWNTEEGKSELEQYEEVSP